MGDSRQSEKISESPKTVENNSGDAVGCDALLGACFEYEKWANFFEGGKSWSYDLSCPRIIVETIAAELGAEKGNELLGAIHSKMTLHRHDGGC